MRGVRIPDDAHAGIEKVLKTKTAIVPAVSYADRVKKRAALYDARKALRAKVATDTNGAAKPNGTHVPTQTIADASFDEPGVLSAFQTFAETINTRLKDFEAEIRADERKKIRERFDAHMASS